MFTKIITILMLFSFTSTLKLPEYFTKCSISNGFNECLLKNIENALPQIVANGDKQFKFGNLNPMMVKSLTLQATPTLTVMLTDVAFGDFKTMKVTDIDLEFKANKMSMKFDLGNFTIEGAYTMDGNLLMLPISGNGQLTFACSDCHATYDTKVSSYDKEGATYYRLSDDIGSVSPSFCKYGLTNLFGGDKTLGDQMVKLLNENWADLYSEAKPALSSALSTLMTTVINKYLTQIPENELYDK